MSRRLVSAQQNALLALLGGALAIACAPIFVRWSQVGPGATAFWRLTLALPFLWSWFYLEKRQVTSPGRLSSFGDYRLFALAGLFFSGDLGFWHWSIKFTTVANATLLVNYAPIFVALGEWLIFGRRVSRGFVIGMGIAMLGTFFLVGASLEFSATRLFGDALGLMAAIFYAGYILTVKYLREKSSTVTIMAFSSLVSAMVLLPVSVWAGEDLLPSNVMGWMILAGLALISQVGGQGLIAYALAQLSAAFSSVALLAQPVMAAVFAWLLLDEALGIWQVCGGVLALWGIMLTRRATSSA